MTTPVCDFVEQYARSEPLRLHMPGHKGRGEIESFDITEIHGAGSLYSAGWDVLRKSEQNASLLFGSAKTLYSAEGSSLCIRAMVYLACLRAEAHGRRPVILAGRNAHATFVSACALMNAEIQWLRGGSLLTCWPTAEELEEALWKNRSINAVYLTSPDYLGNLADIESLASICNQKGIPVLVDNAHGAYLRFLPEDQHPLFLGADLVCDSAHKTLPVLTGGAYLHVHREADPIFYQHMERAMSLFASTSPSWLILQSLDRCNAYLSGDYPKRLAAFVKQADALKERLRDQGFDLVGEEPLKITIAAKSYGYTGNALHDLLRAERIECEFSDPDDLVMMLTPETGTEGLRRLEAALTRIPARPPIEQAPPIPPEPPQAVSPHQAIMAPAEEVPVEKSLGRVLAAPCVSCPPAVPILIMGERITEEAIRCFQYYGIDSLLCAKTKSGYGD